MTDRELQNRLAALPIPPDREVAVEQALEKATAALAQSVGQAVERPEEVSSWTWRDWLWPSPLAWGAFAAVWIIFAGRGYVPADEERTNTPAQLAGKVDQPNPSRSPLLAYAEQRARMQGWQQQLARSK